MEFRSCAKERVKVGVVSTDGTILRVEIFPYIMPLIGYHRERG